MRGDDVDQEEEKVELTERSSLHSNDNGNNSSNLTLLECQESPIVAEDSTAAAAAAAPVAVHDVVSGKIRSANSGTTAAAAAENDNTLPQSNHSNHDMDNLSDSSSTSRMQHERGTACDICLRQYRVGDIVAWSHNPVCDHAYHADCITDWLLHHHQHHNHRTIMAPWSANANSATCPNCRADYLYAQRPRKKNAKGKKDAAAAARRHKPPRIQQSPQQQQQQQQVLRGESLRSTTTNARTDEHSHNNSSHNNNNHPRSGPSSV